MNKTKGKKGGTNEQKGGGKGAHCSAWAGKGSTGLEGHKRGSATWDSAKHFRLIKWKLMCATVRLDAA